MSVMDAVAWLIRAPRTVDPGIDVGSTHIRERVDDSVEGVRHDVRES